MGNDGTMAKGTRYTPEFKTKAVRLLSESGSSYFVGDERDRRGGVETVGRGRDGRVHRHARRLHGLVPGQTHQDGVRHEHHGPTPQARSYGMIGGDGINDKSNKTAPPQVLKNN